MAVPSFVGLKVANRLGIRFGINLGFFRSFAILTCFWLELELG